MDDKELGELIRGGASRWRGANGAASRATFARGPRRFRWRLAATLAGAGAALLMAATAAAGGPGPALESLRLGPLHVGGDAQPAAAESPSPEASATKATEPTPTAATEPTPAPKNEPTPAPKNEPTPGPKNEPTPGGGDGTPTPPPAR